MKTYKVKKFLILIIFLILMIYTYIMSDANKTQNIINEFVSRGEYVCTLDNVEYYKVSVKYAYEDNHNIINNLTDINVGTIGDIYIASSDPFGTYTTAYISKKIKIGHAAIVSSEDALYTYEITGNQKISENVVKECDNDWFTNDFKNDIVVLRVKENISNDEISETISSFKGMKYNYNYLIHKNNSVYCFDLISKVYERLGIDIDNDSVMTYGSKLINDEDTYIIYYKKREKGIYKVYYLGE